MSEIILDAKESLIVECALYGDASDPVKLVRAAGADVSTFFEYGNWEGADFRKSDLTCVSFFGSRIKNAKFTADQRRRVNAAISERHTEQRETAEKWATRKNASAPRNSEKGIQVVKGPVVEHRPHITDSPAAYGPFQRTLKSAVTFAGVGLHTGQKVELTVHPASAEYGLWFRRTDVEDTDNMIPARWDAVRASPLCTRIENGSNVSVSTIEHLLAALAGCGISNALIDLDGPEVPILDGSSAPFVHSILAGGIREQSEPLRAIQILRSVEVRDGDAYVRLEPSESFSVDFAIDFADAAIGKQKKTLNLADVAFVHELADSRTFCRQADVEAMQDAGLALGGTMENAVVVDGVNVLTPGGLRHIDEAVRHKMLDALGDLALANAPIIGRFIGHRSGHMLINRLLRELFADPKSYSIVRVEHTSDSRWWDGYQVDELPFANEKFGQS